nr:MAG TPA: hypothetical protein [Caudoviricetes sp.]
MVKAETPSQNGFHSRTAVTLYSCVLSEHARPISAEGVPSGFRVLVARAPRTLKPSLIACTPFRAVPARADAEPLRGSVLSAKTLRLEGVKADAPPSFFYRVLLPS